MFAASERRCTNVQNFRQRKERKCSLESTRLCSVSYWSNRSICCTIMVIPIFVKKYIIVFIIIIYLFTAIGLLPGGSGYFTFKQNMKLATTRFKSGGLHEKHVVATWNVGNRLRICL